MTSILFKIVRIYGNQFKYNYLKNKKSFWIFRSISEIYIKFWTFLKKVTLTANVFPKLWTANEVVR